MKFLILLWHDWFDFQHAKTATYQKNWGGIGRIFDRVVQGSLKIHAHPGSLGMSKDTIYIYVDNILYISCLRVKDGKAPLRKVDQHKSKTKKA